jgi:hypothetical protein
METKTEKVQITASGVRIGDTVNAIAFKNCDGKYIFPVLNLTVESILHISGYLDYYRIFARGARGASVEGRREIF